MEEALSCIGKMPIFSGIREEELYTLIKCCDGQMAVFEKTSGSFRQEKNWDISWLFKGTPGDHSGRFWHQQKRRSILCRERYLVKITPAQAVKYCL